MADLIDKPLDDIIKAERASRKPRGYVLQIVLRAGYFLEALG